MSTFNFKTATPDTTPLDANFFFGADSQSDATPKIYQNVGLRTLLLGTATSTLAIAAGKTLTASNTLTFTGTDSSAVAFGTGGTVLYNAGALGTPASGVLTNCTGLPSILAANEATDTTCFPAFFTAATGELGPKTNAALTFNSLTGALGVTSVTAGVLSCAYLARSAPVTETNSTHTVAVTTSYLIANRAGDITVTLPTASSFTGRELMIKTIQAQTVTSNASNVVPSTSATAGTAILPATDGAWALLISDGTNWIIMAASPLV